jgi:hypothetical protein
MAKGKASPAKAAAAGVDGEVRYICCHRDGVRVARSLVGAGTPASACNHAPRGSLMAQTAGRVQGFGS